MPINFTGGTSGSSNTQQKLEPEVINRRTVRQANLNFAGCMTFTFSAATCFYTQFMIPFETNLPYVLLSGGFAFSALCVAGLAVRNVRNACESQNHENFLLRSVCSYDRQLKKSQLRADDANRTAGLRRRNEADGDGGTEYSPSASGHRVIPIRGTVK